jgi:hypothetical protein
MYAVLTVYQCHCSICGVVNNRIRTGKMLTQDDARVGNLTNSFSHTYMKGEISTDFPASKAQTRLPVLSFIMYTCK